MAVEVGAESRFVRIIVTGKFSLPEAQKTFALILCAAWRHQIWNVLFDAREVLDSISNMRRFYVGEFATDESNQLINQRRGRRSPRFAYVLPPAFDSLELQGNIAVQGGVRMKAFANLEDAIRWLKR